MDKSRSIIQYTANLLLITWLMIACSVQPTAVIQPPPKASPSATPRVTPTNTATAMPTTTPTPETPALFLTNPHPPDLIDMEALGGIQLSDDPNAPLWFGLADVRPEGEIIHTANWIYALAAPFPTLTDEITLSDLKSLWKGKLPSESSINRLYIPKIFLHNWQTHWGKPADSTIRSYTIMPNVERLWEEDAWIILPFETLSPKLKVIQIDGISPLLRDFDIANYPLKLTFELVKNPAFANMISDRDLHGLSEAIKPTNRDPNKLTNLVMTGVTALVRGIAHRMEIYGVTHPGEEIRHWLTEADLTHISNEVSFYEDCPPPDPSSGRLLFCSDPKYIELFEFVGADIIELTGNHNNDSLYMYGVDVVPFTLDLYDQYGMVYYGGGRNLSDAKSPLLIDHNGNQLAFIGCNTFGPDFAWATEDQGGAAPCEDYQWMADEISRLKNEGYLPIATLQYYEDYYNFAGEHHIRDFAQLAEAGAVIVNGSQAHRPKAMSFNHDAYIDYGLGNLFFDQKWYVDDYDNIIEQTSWEIIQRHTFYEGRHLSTELLTAKLIDYSQPRPMTLSERLIFLEELFSASGWNPR